MRDIGKVVIAAFLLFPMNGLGQGNDLPPAVWVNCDLPSGKNAIVVSPTVTAKNGSDAWVQIVSVLAPRRGMCLNTTTLWVSNGRLHPYLPIFTQSPVYPNLEGNSMQIIDWSPDSRLLLTGMWQWNTEPNDAPIPRSVLVFEPQKKVKHQIDIYRLIDDQPGRDCEVHFDLLGFTPDNWVALKARISTFYDVDEDETTKPKDRKCKESTQWLSINPLTQARRPLPSTFHAAHYHWSSAAQTVGDEGVASLIARFQSERAVEAKEAIIFEITQHHREAGQQLLQVAQETDDMDTKWLAIRGLGGLKYQPATQFLISSLSSPHHYVRSNAARALGDLRANSAKAELLSLLKTEQENGVIEQTALALEMLKAPEAIPVLRARADNVSNAQTQCWLIDAIADIGNKGNVPFVAKRLYAEDPTVGMCAAGALQQLSGEDLHLGFHEGPISPSDIVSKGKLWWEQNASRWK